MGRFSLPPTPPRGYDVSPYPSKLGRFLYDGYNSGIYANIILSIVTIGLVGLVLDRLMSLVEARFKTA